MKNVICQGFFSVDAVSTASILLHLQVCTCSPTKNRFINIRHIIIMIVPFDLLMCYIVTLCNIEWLLVHMQLHPLRPT